MYGAFNPIRTFNLLINLYVYMFIFIFIKFLFLFSEFIVSITCINTLFIVTYEIDFYLRENVERVKSLTFKSNESVE